MADEPPSRAQRQRRQIAVFLLLAVAMAALLIGGIAYQRGNFESMSQAYFIADEVTGMAPGTVVRMSGLRVGRVSALELQDDLKVKVTITIDSKPFGYLRSDALAELVREQLKPAAIDLRVGKAATPLSADDPHLAFKRRGTLTEIADDLRARLVPILDDVKVLTGVAREHREDLSATIANTRALTQELVATAKELHALGGELHGRVARIGGQSETLIGETNRSVVKLRGVVDQAGQSLATVNARLPAMLDKTDSALARLNGVLADGKEVSAAAAADLPPTLHEAPAIADDARATVQGLTQSWPLRSLLPAPPSPLLPIDSFESFERPARIGPAAGPAGPASAPPPAPAP